MNVLRLLVTLMFSLSLPLLLAGCLKINIALNGAELQDPDANPGGRSSYPCATDPATHQCLVNNPPGCSCPPGT